MISCAAPPMSRSAPGPPSSRSALAAFPPPISTSSPFPPNKVSATFAFFASPVPPTSVSLPSSPKSASEPSPPSSVSLPPRPYSPVRETKFGDRIIDEISRDGDAISSRGDSQQQVVPGTRRNEALRRNAG